MSTKKHSSDKKSLTPRYALIHATFWMVYAASTSYTSVYLLDAGFTNTQIGFLIAAVSLISAFLQPMTAAYADKPQSPSLKKIVSACCALFAMLAAILILSGMKIPVVIILCYGGLVMINQLLIPLVNALGMQSINQGKNLNFGIARGIGSVAYAIATYFIGILVAMSGTAKVPVCALVLALSMIFTVTIFPFKKTPVSMADSSKKAKKQTPFSSLLYFFEHYRSFCYVLIGYCFICTSHTLLSNFAFQIISTKGGGTAEVGTSLSLAAMSELPTMFFFSWFLKKAPAATWYKTASVFFVLKAVGSLLAPNVMTFYAVQFLQMGAWALNTVSSVYYVNSIMDKQDAIKGQACMTMAFTLGNVVSALFGGPILDHIGVTAVLLFAIITGTLGMIMIQIHAKTPKTI